MSNICVVCGEDFAQARANLGYNTCLQHAEPQKIFTVAPAFNKGAYQLITRSEVQHIGR
jgi:hypothetical protein